MTGKHQLIGSNELCRTLLDATPLPMFVLNEDVEILDFNAAAGELLGKKRKFIIRQRGGAVLHCIHSTETPGGCGCSSACKKCVIRKSVKASITGKKWVREKAEMDLVSDSVVKQTQLLISTTPFRYRGRRLALLVLEDITELLALRKLLPICARCRKVRDDQEYWHKLDHYLSAYLQVEVAQGLCPDCIAQTRSLTPILSGQRRARAAD